MFVLPAHGSQAFAVVDDGAPAALHGVAGMMGPAPLAGLERLLRQASRALDSDPEAVRRSLRDAVSLLNGEARPKTAPGAAGLAPWQARRTANYIEDRLDGGIYVSDLADLVRLSASQFSRAFKATFGQPPCRYITRQRVARAQRLMLGTDEPLCQIAGACGFADQSHMSRVFREQTGDTPHAWRRMHVESPPVAAA